MNRRLLAVFALVAFVTLAGCADFGRATSEEGLHQDATYDWDTNADVTIDVGGDEYTAVYTIANRSSMRIYQDTAYGDDRPIGIRAVQFRYPNGTVVEASDMEIEETRSEVIVELPAERGQFAFTASTRPKSFSLPTFVGGSYEVILPESHRVDNVVLSTVRPGGYETELVDDRVHIRWDDVTSRSVHVRYYLERDLFLFTGLLVVVSIVGAVALGYVWRQVKELRRRREELGFDVDVDEDVGRRPPPGMG